MTVPDFLVPGVYVQEVDSGANPIERVPSSWTGMVGLLSVEQLRESLDFVALDRQGVTLPVPAFALSRNRRRFVDGAGVVIGQEAMRMLAGRVRGTGEQKAIAVERWEEALENPTSLASYGRFLGTAGDAQVRFDGGRPQVSSGKDAVVLGDDDYESMGNAIRLTTDGVERLSDWLGEAGEDARPVLESMQVSEPQTLTLGEREVRFEPNWPTFVLEESGWTQNHKLRADQFEWLGEDVRLTLAGIEDTKRWLRNAMRRDATAAGRVADLASIFGLDGVNRASTDVTFERTPGEVALSLRQRITELVQMQELNPMATNFSEFLAYLARVVGAYLSIELGEGAELELTKGQLEAVVHQLSADPNLLTFILGARGYFENGGSLLTANILAVGDKNLDEVSLNAIQGLDLFEDYADLTLLCGPGLRPKQRKELLEFAVRSNRFAIVDGDYGRIGASAQECSELSDTKGHGAVYVPAIRVPYVDGQQKPRDHMMGPSAHIAGLYGRVDSDRGVHKAPANVQLFGVTALTHRIGDRHQSLLNPYGINAIRDFQQNGGIVVYGARTTATLTNAQWKYVPIRRLFTQIERSVQRALRWAVFEPNDPSLWAKLRRNISAFLNLYWRDGALFGANPEEAFYVKCDAETNPPEVRDAGQVIIEVGIAPVKPAEFVVFQIGQWDGGGRITEA